MRSGNLRARLHHACLIIVNQYPLPEEVEEFCIMTILSDIADIKSDIASIKSQLASLPDGTSAAAALSSRIDALSGKVGEVDSAVGAINAEIGTEPPVEQPPLQTADATVVDDGRSGQAVDQSAVQVDEQPATVADPAEEPAAEPAAEPVVDPAATIAG